MITDCDKHQAISMILTGRLVLFGVALIAALYLYVFIASLGIYQPPSCVISENLIQSNPLQAAKTLLSFPHLLFHCQYSTLYLCFEMWYSITKHYNYRKPAQVISCYLQMVALTFSLLTLVDLQENWKPFFFFLLDKNSKMGLHDDVKA